MKCSESGHFYDLEVDSVSGPTNVSLTYFGAVLLMRREICAGAGLSVDCISLCDVRGVTPTPQGRQAEKTGRVACGSAEPPHGAGTCNGNDETVTSAVCKVTTVVRISVAS